MGQRIVERKHKKAKLCLHLQKLDVRAVRGPLTRGVLIKNGQQCPEIYGDPAILMPMFYQPTSAEKKHRVSVIIHHTHVLDRKTIPADGNIIEILTTDYEHFIDEVCASKLVISSSLHGIILAEAYGVPAVFLAGDDFDLFKYKDYYMGTGRDNMVYARSIEEALTITPMPLPELDHMQKALLNAFPKDLWESK